MASELGLRIRELRAERGISQSALGNALGYEQKTISSWETGRSRVSSEVVPALAAELGATISELYGVGVPAESVHVRTVALLKRFAQHGHAVECQCATDARSLLAEMA